MSQKKVDAYKEYKKNKEQILKREKRMKKIEFGVIVAICCLLGCRVEYITVRSIKYKSIIYYFL